MNYQEQINALKAEIELLKNTTSIPYEIDAAFRNRLNIDLLAKLLTQTDKSATAENVTTSAGGGNIVLGAPDGFLVYTDSTATARYIPFYL